MNRQEDEALRVRMGDENLARAAWGFRPREPHEMGEWREVQMMWRWSAAGDSLDTKIVCRWRWP